MKRIFYLIALICMATHPATAQEKQSYTLEDVIPGGTNYASLTPASLPGLQWWGDVCVRTDSKDIKTIDVKNGKETVLLTLEEVNEALGHAEAECPSGCKLKPLEKFTATFFPKDDEKIIILRQDNHVIRYCFGKQKILSVIHLRKSFENLYFNKGMHCAAYTVGSDLYVTGEGGIDRKVNPERADEPEAGQLKADHDLVYGQSVHRNEFGINKGIFWSPQGNCVAFYRMDQSMVTDYPQVNTTARTARLEPDKYPMAGMNSHKVTVGVYHVKTGKTVYLQAGDPTDRYFTNVTWAPDEKSIYVIELNRDQNQTQLVRYRTEDGAKEAVLYEETHPKYVEPMHPLVFLPWDSSQFIYQSQRDGFNHLYLFDTKSSVAAKSKDAAAGGKYVEYVKVTQLTQGNWLVQEVLGFNPSRKELVIGSTEISPLQTNLFRLSLKTGKRTLIGREDGMHRAQLSASGTYLIDYFTSNEVPREVSILPVNGKKAVSLLTATDPMREKFRLPEITVGTIKAADGKTDLYYRLIKPVDFDPNRKYPAIIYVYGGPHAQMIHNTRFYDAQGWDLYMAQKGYVMLTVDGRGSENRGLEFENCTFRQLGTEEMKDQVEGAKFLQSLPYVDGSRIGVHGWSFGGFMTTNLMLTYPDLFKTGVAGGPVIDWQFYEIMYGERYMDTPQANPEGYKQANLREKAGRLKGRLLIIHGGMDPTCVPQHSYTFLRACIDAGTHPDFFIYPEDGHNMLGRDRVHLHEHITRYFDDFLK